MVTLSRIYTRTGDGGETMLGDGTMTAKDDPRVAAYGTVDEANAVIGLARLETATDPALAHLDALLAGVQNRLFDVGADLCVPYEESEEKGARLRIEEATITALEQAIDDLNGDLAPLKSFILPGGSRAAAQLHLARTAVRRAERLGWAAARSGRVHLPALKYLNRLSDLLFVIARAANQASGHDDRLWQPGAN